MEKPIYIKDIIKDKNLFKKLKLKSIDEEAQKREDAYFAALGEEIEQYPIVSPHFIKRG